MNQFSPETLDLARRAEDAVKEQFAKIDAIAEANTAKILEAYREMRVSESFFAGTTGYGYDDRGRDALDEIYAKIFGAEKGICRLQFVNGTHALACALYGSLRPGQKLISAIGDPYDTLHGVIGIGENVLPGSLKDYGIGYRGIPAAEDGNPDYEALRRALTEEENVGCVLIQRSKGYSTRKSLSVEVIGKLCSLIHEVRPEAVAFVDNCYGEFVEEIEPCQVGADLMAGSLIKNPGGGLAPSGGYVVGRADLVDRAAERLTVPGIGGEVGATFGQNRLLYHGLFLAPHTVAQAVKTSVFAASALSLLGYDVDPLPDAKRVDIIQQIRFGEPKPLIKFCQGIQAGSPVDAYVTPEPWDMPGYEDQVIMAAGNFIQGASIELSCDAPMREPYACYLQGGLTYESGKYGVMTAIEKMKD